MIVELVAGRLIARHLGSSLYTWTSIIAVILAGMSIGNFLGGRFADRWRPEKLLGWLFMIASAMCLFTLFLNNVFAENAPEWITRMSWELRTIFSVFAIFLLPAMSLGTISPVTAKMALSRSDTVGATIGSVYAWGAVGSIVGTLATGFLLIAWMGSKSVIISVALGLAVVGTVLGPRRLIQAIWAILVGALLVLSNNTNKTIANMTSKLGVDQTIVKIADRLGVREDTDYDFAVDGNYQYVKVREEEAHYASGEKYRRRVLALDWLIHGYIDPDDPLHLVYSYEHVYAEMARRVIGGNQSPATFFIGGGSYTFPRWVLANWPTAKVDVAEIDPVVVRANYEALGLPRDAPIRTMVMDARNAIDSLPASEHYDAFFGDAFNDLSVPFHLLTLEFCQKVKNHLNPGGALLANLIDNYQSGLLLGRYYLTLKQAFKNVYVFCTDRTGVTEFRDTFVLVATDRDLDVSGLEPGHEGGIDASLLTEANISSLIEKCGRQILTDDYAPVENLLAPVVRQRKG